MGGRGQIPAGLRRAAGDHGEVFRGKPGFVFPEQRHGGLLPLNGIYPALPGLQRHLDGHRPGTRTYIPADGIRSQLQLGQANGPHLALGHRDHTVVAAASLKGRIRQAMGNNVLCPPVFDQRHAQGLKGLFRKLRRRIHGDLFVRIAEFFAHADPDVPQAGVCKGPAQAGHAVLSAHQGKHPGIGADIRHNIVLSPMNTDGNHIFIRGPQPRTEIGKRTEARKHLHLRIFEFRQKLLCPAEKSHIPGHHHGEAAVFPVGGNMRGDGLRIDGVKNRLSGAGHRLGHAFGADDAVCLFDGGPDFTGHGGPAAGADAHHRHPGLPVQAEAPAHQLQRVGKAAALPLGGAANDHQHRARGTGGGRLFRKTAPAAALLGDQVRGRHRFEHSHVHFH